LRQPGATIIPVIISSDKTQLTQFRDHMAYPIYLTIGNISKNVRRKPSRMAQMLIGYIPTSKLLGLTNKAARRRAVANLFHACMRDVLHPLIVPGERGVAMMTGDGVWRRCHPILASFVGDYPEQALVTCTYYGQCPKCVVPPGELGEYHAYPPRIQNSAIDTYHQADKEVRVFHAACRDAGVKPIYHPFWVSLPHADIFASITPDVLHQLLQGVMKHLIEWLIEIFGPTEINARCRAMPPNHKVMLFTKGITTLSRVSGHEHKKMCCILLGLIVDLPIPSEDSTHLVCAVRALLDFLYLTQFQCHTSESIGWLNDALSAFHNHKAIFSDLGVREHFNIPKLHSLTHYISSICLFGTTDNYNTEQTERLHIDFTKEAYRSTNRKDIYSQMTVWLQRREKILLHAMTIHRRQNEHPESEQPQTGRIPEPPHVPTQSIKMALNPTKSVTFNVLACDYGAVDFQDALADFLAHLNNPGASVSALRQRAENILIPFRSVPVFHNIKFTKCGDSGEHQISDTVHVRPGLVDKRAQIVPARFDTVIVRRQGNKGILFLSKQDI
jgi:Plavaka transposase